MKKKKALSILKNMVKVKEQLDIDSYGHHMINDDRVCRLVFTEEIYKALKKAVKVMEKEV